MGWGSAEWGTPRAVESVVLIVEDDADIQESLGSLLQSKIRPVKILRAASAEEAERIPELQRIDVAIVDYLLPGMSGIEFLERLRRARPDVPTILITAHRDPSALAEAVNRGRVARIIFKPPDPEELAKIVSDFAARRAGSVKRISRF